MDGASYPPYPSDVELFCDDIKAIFLPTNITPVLQSKEQGVLKIVKLSYEKYYYDF